MSSYRGNNIRNQAQPRPTALEVNCCPLGDSEFGQSDDWLDPKSPAPPLLETAPTRSMRRPSPN